MVKLRKLSKSDYRSWPFALLVGVVLGVLVLVDRGSLNTNSITAACRVEVTADVLSERSGPSPDTSSQVDRHKGDILGAQAVVQNHYRKLVDGNWALDAYLRPLPGSKC